jgi:hypothetical protein
MEGKIRQNKIIKSQRNKTSKEVADGAGDYNRPACFYKQNTPLKFLKETRNIFKRWSIDLGAIRLLTTAEEVIVVENSTPWTTVAAAADEANLPWHSRLVRSRGREIGGLGT